MSSTCISVNDLVLSNENTIKLGLLPINSTVKIVDKDGLNTLLYTKLRDIKGLFAYKLANGKLDYSNRVCKIVSVLRHPTDEGSYLYDVIVDIGSGKSVKTFISTNSVCRL